MAVTVIGLVIVIVIVIVIGRCAIGGGLVLAGGELVGGTRHSCPLGTALLGEPR